MVEGSRSQARQRQVVTPLGTRLLEIRLECGLTIPEVVRLSAGTFSASYLYQVEGGKIADPGINKVRQLALLYDIDLDELLELPSRRVDLKPQEADLLRVFRRLNARDRLMVFEITKVFARLHAKRARSK